jgi:hypothetical protein
VVFAYLKHKEVRYRLPNIGIDHDPVSLAAADEPQTVMQTYMAKQTDW